MCMRKTEFGQWDLPRQTLVSQLSRGSVARPTIRARCYASLFSLITILAQALVLTILLFFREDLIGWVHMEFGSYESLVCVASPQYRAWDEMEEPEYASHSESEEGNIRWSPLRLRSILAQFAVDLKDSKLEFQLSNVPRYRLVRCVTQVHVPTEPRSPSLLQ